MSFLVNGLRGPSATRLPARIYTYANARSLHATRLAPASYKENLQDKDSLNPTSSEYSKSGGDNAAAHQDGAFDPKTTDPGTEQQQSESQEGNPLQVSPADDAANATKGEKSVDRSPNESEGKTRMSGAGNQKKAGKTGA